MAYVVDFESKSRCDLKKAGAWRYAEHPTTEVLCLSYGPVNSEALYTWFPGQSQPLSLLEAIEAGEIFIAHNAGFEQAMWARHMVDRYNWPAIPVRQWHDTQARCASIAIPQALEKVGKALQLTTEKDMEGNRLTLSLSRVDKKTGELPEVTPFTLLRVGQYCEVDVKEQRELHRRIGWLEPDERQVWLLDQRTNQRGVRLDVPLIAAMRQVVDRGSAPLAEEFARLTGGLKMTQRDKVMAWMLARGVMMPNMTKETLAAVLGETDEGEEIDEDDRLDLDLPAEVERALRIRQLIGSSSIKKLGAMEACVCDDGRARGLLAYHAASTGRFAGRLIQPQNFPRGNDVEIDIDGKIAAIMTGDPDFVYMALGYQPVETVVASLRHAIISNPDRYLVAGDFAGIEARLALALAGQHDKTELMASGVDVYCDMAATIYGHPVNKKEHPEKRQIGKNSVLGLGFGMGAPKFHSRYAKDQPLEFIQSVVAAYRKNWAPKVPDLWKGLEHAAIRAVWDGGAHEAYGVSYRKVDQWLVATYPDGSKQWYFDPRPTRQAMPWDPEDIRRSWTYRQVKQGRLITINAYGALLTENYAQHMARQLLIDAWKKAEKERIPIVLTVHDELVGEPESSRQDAETVLAQIMEDRPDWAREIKLPVAVETWAGDRYRK